MLSIKVLIVALGLDRSGRARELIDWSPAILYSLVVHIEKSKLKKKRTAPSRGAGLEFLLIVNTLVP
jgi:hypothetical protein